MFVLLSAFSLFNLVVGMASLGQAVRLLTAEERSYWRSKTLYVFALVLAWTFPMAAAGATWFAWDRFNALTYDFVMPVIMAPIAWLMLMGVVFALVDFMEDGVLGNARGRTPTES